MLPTTKSNPTASPSSGIVSSFTWKNILHSGVPSISSQFLRMLEGKFSSISVSASKPSRFSQWIHVWHGHGKIANCESRELLSVAWYSKWQFHNNGPIEEHFHLFHHLLSGRENSSVVSGFPSLVTDYSPGGIFSVNLWVNGIKLRNERANSAVQVTVSQLRTYWIEGFEEQFHLWQR